MLGAAIRRAGDAAAFPWKAGSSTLRQLGTFSDVAHRPWPIPERPWFMAQTWRHLLFAHWAVDPAQLRTVMPPQLEPDVREGVAWIAITPFRVEAFRLRRTLPLPLLSQFLEVNVRTYVTVDERPGIYFLSLDASSRLAVSGARRTYRLPYFRAAISLQREKGTSRVLSRRAAADGPPAELGCTYQPEGDAFTAPHGSLEYFLTERYCLYTLDDRGEVQRAEIHHPPWPLQRADADFTLNSMTEGLGLPLVGRPVLHYAERQDVLLWTIEPS
jgi:uncharacterized protein